MFFTSSGEFWDYLFMIFSVLTMMCISVFFKKYLAWGLLFIASGEWCQIRHLWSREFSFGTRDTASGTQNFGKSFITVKKRESFCHRIQKGAESAPLTSLIKTLYTFFSWLLTKERSCQTHSHNIHFKIIGLVRRFLLRRRNMSSSKIKLLFYNH